MTADGDRLKVGWLNRFPSSGRGAATAEDAHGIPTQSHISPSILVYEDEREWGGEYTLDLAVFPDPVLDLALSVDFVLRQHLNTSVEG